MLKRLKIDGTYSVEYDPTNNDRPARWFHHGQPFEFMPSNVVLAVFYRVLELEEDLQRAKDEGDAASFWEPGAPGVYLTDMDRVIRQFRDQGHEARWRYDGDSLTLEVKDGDKTHSVIRAMEVLRKSEVPLVLVEGMALTVWKILGKVDA